MSEQNSELREKLLRIVLAEKSQMDTLYNEGPFYEWIESGLSVKSRLSTDQVSSIEQLINSEVRSARLEENAWSRQQMIVAQAYEAPNSGFGRMIKWAIGLLNERKLGLLNKEKEELLDIKQFISSEVVKVLNRLSVQQRICHDCIHDDEELGTVPYVSLSAIEAEKSKYGTE